MAVSILWTIDDASDADDEPLFQLSQDSVTTDLTTGGGKETRIKVDYLGDSVQCQLYLDRFFTARSPARDVYSAIEPHLLGVLNGIDATAFVRIGPRPPQSPLGVLFGETPLWDGVSSPEVVQPTDGIAVRVLKKLFLEMQSESLRGFDSYSVRMGFCCFMNAPDKPTDLLKNVKQQVPKNLEWGNSESVLPGKYVYLTTVVDTLRTLTKLLQSSSFRPVIHRLSYCLHFLILKAPADTAPAHAANAKVAHLVFTDIHEDHVQCAQRALAPAVQKLQSDRRNAGSPAAGLPRSASFFSDAGHDLLPGPGGLHMSPKAGQAAGQRPAQKKGPGNGSAQPEGILGSCFGLLKSSRSARLVMLAAAKVSGPLTSQQQVHADAAVQILAEVQKMGAVHGPTLVFPALPLHTVPGPALGAAVRPAYSPPVDHHLALVPSLRELSESPPRYSPPIPGRPMEIHDPNPYEDRLAGAMSVRRGMRAPSYIMGTTTPGGARRAHSPGRLHSPVGDRGFEGMDPVGNFDTNALVNTPYAQTPTTYLQSTARLIARQSMGQAPLGDHVGPGFRHVHPLNQRDPDNNEHPIPDAPTSYDSTAIDAFPSMPAHHTAVYPGDSPPAPPTRVPYNFSEQYSLSLSQARNTVAGVQAARHASPAPHLMHKRAAATPPAAGGGRSEVLIRDCRIHELEGLVGNLEARLVELGGVNGETWLSRVEVEAVRRENEELKMELSALSKRSEAEGNSWRSRIVALESEHTARLHELQTVLRREAYGDKQSPAAADHRALQAHVFELEQRCLRAEQDREDAVLRGRAVGATSEDLKTQIAGLRASSAELEARLQSEAIARDAADKDVDRLQQINQHTMEQLSAIRRSTAEYEMERRMTRSEMDATRAQLTEVSLELEKEKAHSRRVRLKLESMGGLERDRIEERESADRSRQWADYIEGLHWLYHTCLKYGRARGPTPSITGPASSSSPLTRMDDVQVLRERLSQRDAQLYAKTSEVVRLEQEAADARARTRDIECDAQRTSSMYEERIRVLEVENAAFSKQNDHHMLELRRLAGHAQNSEADKFDQQDVLRRIKAEHAAMKETVDDVTRQRSQAVQEAEMLRRKQSQAESITDKEVMRLSAELRQRETQIADMRRQNTTLQQISDKHLHCERIRKTLQATMAEHDTRAERLRMENERLEQQLGELSRLTSVAEGGRDVEVQLLRSEKDRFEFDRKALQDELRLKMDEAAAHAAARDQAEAALVDEKARTAAREAELRSAHDHLNLCKDEVLSLQQKLAGGGGRAEAFLQRSPSPAKISPGLRSAHTPVLSEPGIDMARHTPRPISPASRAETIHEHPSVSAVSAAVRAKLQEQLSGMHSSKPLWQRDAELHRVPSQAAAQSLPSSARHTAESPLASAQQQIAQTQRDLASLASVLPSPFQPLSQRSTNRNISPQLTPLHSGTVPAAQFAGSAHQPQVLPGPGASATYSSQPVQPQTTPTAFAAGSFTPIQAPGAYPSAHSISHAQSSYASQGPVATFTSHPQHSPPSQAAVQSTPP